MIERSVSLILGNLDTLGIRSLSCISLYFSNRFIRER
jgi:hypothetical protein